MFKILRTQELKGRHAQGPVDQRCSLRREVNLRDLKGTIAPSRGGSYSITSLTCCSSALRINSYLEQRKSIYSPL